MNDIRELADKQWKELLLNTSDRGGSIAWFVKFSQFCCKQLINSNTYTYNMYWLVLYLQSTMCTNGLTLIRLGSVKCESKSNQNRMFSTHNLLPTFSLDKTAENTAEGFNSENEKHKSLFILLSGVIDKLKQVDTGTSR